MAVGCELDRGFFPPMCMWIHLLTPESLKLPFVQESQLSLALTSHEAQAFPNRFGIFSSHLPPLLTGTKLFSKIMQPQILVARESIPLPV